MVIPPYDSFLPLQKFIVPPTGHNQGIFAMIDKKHRDFRDLCPGCLI